MALILQSFNDNKFYKMRILKASKVNQNIYFILIIIYNKYVNDHSLYNQNKRNSW